MTGVSSSQRVVAFICFWWVCTIGTVAAGAPDTFRDRDRPTVADPEKLVEQLGDDHFAARERAMDQLVRIGAAAIPALQQGLKAKDRETRFRCRHALRIVHALDFQRRLSAFANGQDADESYALPGWEQFREQASDDADARGLFVQMQKQERDLLRLLSESPGELEQAILTRVTQLRHSVGLHPQETNISQGTMVALLFAANNCPTELPREAADYLSSVLRGSDFSGMVHSGALQEPLRKMLGMWIESCQGWNAFQGMLLSLQYDMPQGLAAATRVLGQPSGQPVEPLIRSYALLTVARFGDQTNLSLVEPLLDDPTPFSGEIPTNRKGKFQTQIRDLALATAIRLSNQKHAEFGFDRLRPHSFYVFNTSTIGFENDTKREAALRKWRGFRNQ